MNTSKSLLAAVIVSLLAIAGCQEKSSMEKVEDKVNDALDRRPSESVRDAAEDVGDAAKEFGDAVKDAAKDIAEETKDAAKEVKEAAKDATR